MHPRAARVPALAGKDARVEKPEQFLPRRLVVPDRLEADQNRRDFAFSLIDPMSTEPSQDRSSTTLRM